MFDNFENKNMKFTFEFVYKQITVWIQSQSTNGLTIVK